MAKLAWSALCTFLFMTACDTIDQDVPPLPTSGPEVSALKEFDRVMWSIMHKWEIPGAALALAKDGRLLLAHGYGYVDRQGETLVRPDSLFRIASLSKPITAATVLRLVDEGKLSLEDPVLEVLAEPGLPTDPRFAEVTIRHLLIHAGGWDKDVSGDPMIKRAAVFHGSNLPSCANVIRFQIEQPLDFTPGTRFAYANFGYCLLGRAIERVSGMSYEDAVRTYVLGPAGATSMRLGKTTFEHRMNGEVAYHGTGGENPYGSYGKVTFAMEAMDAVGGWVGSAIDLVRFASAVDGRPDPPDILREETLVGMVSYPGFTQREGKSDYYAMGWHIHPMKSGDIWYHPGSWPGSVAVLARYEGGAIFAALFNARPPEYDKMMDDVGERLSDAVFRVRSWPEQDLFAGF